MSQIVQVVKFLCSISIVSPFYIFLVCGFSLLCVFLFCLKVDKNLYCDPSTSLPRVLAAILNLFSETVKGYTFLFIRFCAHL